MFIWFWNRHKPSRPHKPHKKVNFISILLIVVGVLLVMIYTPPTVWCILLGLGLIATGIWSLSKWR